MTTALDKTFSVITPKIINQFGKTMTHAHIPTPTYTQSTGRATATALTQVIKGVIRDPSYVDFQGDEVVSGDRFVLVAGAGITNAPTPGDKLTIDGDVWFIKRVSPTFSGELVAVYDLHIRQ